MSPELRAAMVATLGENAMRLVETVVENTRLRAAVLGLSEKLKATEAERDALRPPPEPTEP